MGKTPGRAEQRFPGFNVVDESDTWDPTTSRVVLRRLERPGPLKFFTTEEEPTARAVVDRILAQDEEPKVPVLEPIDERLADGRGDGYRYADMPEDGKAWRLSLAHLDEDARSLCGRPFAEAERIDQLRLMEGVRTAEEPWHGLPGKRVFSLWMRYSCTAFYSHPWAWNEIGFGGPAYPRGYKNLGLDRREPWEVRERDAEDPIPWIVRAEEARGRHIGALGEREHDQ